MSKDKIKIQTSKDFKSFDKDKLLEKQNEIRAKYGLRPLKRLYLESFFILDTNSYIKPRKDIPVKDGGMYQ